MTGPRYQVPRAVVAGQITDEQWTAIFTFYGQHPERWLPGTAITAAVANEAIDWFNKQGVPGDEN